MKEKCIPFKCLSNFIYSSKRTQFYLNLIKYLKKSKAIRNLDMAKEKVSYNSNSLIANIYKADNLFENAKLIVIKYKKFLFNLHFNKVLAPN